MAEESNLAEKIKQVRRDPSKDHPPGFYEQVLDWLHHSDATVRREALLFLGHHLRQRSDAQELLEMVAADPDPEVRKMAADCLGGVFRSTRHQRVNEVLAAAAKNTEEEGQVRAAAYAAIKRINGY